MSDERKVRERVGRLPDWTEKERAAIDSLVASQGLTEQQVIRQALRNYQMICERIHAGETVTWSGDEARAREFSGSSSPTLAEVHRDES